MPDPNDPGASFIPCRECGGKGFKTKMKFPNTQVRIPCEPCEERGKRFRKIAEDLGLVPKPA